MDCKILFEDKDMLVVIKPQGMPVQEDKTGDESLLSRLEQYCGQSLGLVHRLDRPVGGVMVFAKTKVAETAFVKQMQEKNMVKIYWAVILGKLPEKTGMLTDYLKKNMRTNLSEVVSLQAVGAKKAVLQYTVLEEREAKDGIVSFVEITLDTGRHHQIRVQMAHQGTPIWGDRKYGNQHLQREGREIALWAVSLSGFHPITKKPWFFQEPPQGNPFSDFLEKRKNC